MPNNGGAVLHHISKRKRSLDNIPHKYPAKSRAVALFDKFMMIIAIINPLVAIPQIIHIYALKNAIGLSFPSWLGYSLFNIPWLIYGIIHKEKPLILAYILVLIFNVAILVGVILYG